MNLPEAARAALDGVRRRTDAHLPAGSAAGARAGLPAWARIDVHFHPDRIGSDGRSVAASLARDGVYRNQFETGTSNGGLTAHIGGDRYRWESRLFDGAYDGPDVAPGDRPIYGAVNMRRYVNGASPRFGSCALRLRPEVLARTTCSPGDSAFSLSLPVLAGDADCAEVAPDMEQYAGDRATRPSPMINHVLDDYAEAHVHGGILLRRDVEEVVADASFRGSGIESSLRSIAPDGRIIWTPALSIAPEAIPPEFRLPELPELAGHVSECFAGAAGIDASVVGAAANDITARSCRGQWSADGWREWGTPAECRQLVKYLWHAVVAFS